MLTVLPRFKENSEQIQDEEIIEILRLFRRTDFRFQTLVIDQVPNLSLMMHDFELSSGKVWSIWDEIQDVHRPGGIPLSMDDIEIPEGMTVFTGWPATFIDDEMSHRQEIVFHDRGFVTKIIENTNDGRTISQYDYRGFLSYKDWYDRDNFPVKREWYNATGRVVMTQAEGEIRVATDQLSRFDKEIYNDREEIVLEFLGKYLARFKENAILAKKTLFTVNFLEKLKAIDQLYYLASYRQIVNESIDFVLQEKDHYVLPTTVDRDMFKEKVVAHPDNQGISIDGRLRVIPLFPTELDLGISNDLALMNIYWFWGDYPDKSAVELMARFLEILDDRDDIAVQAEVGPNSNAEELQDVWEQMIAAFYELDIEDKFYQQVKTYLTEIRDDKPLSLNMKEIKKMRKDVHYDYVSGAFEVYFRLSILEPQTRRQQNALISQARVYLDTGDLPNLRLQTASISAGIPQITQRSRGMMEDGVTGMIAKTQTEMISALHHYLDELRPWNEALVENVKVLERYQEARVIQDWEDFVYGSER